MEFQRFTDIRKEMCATHNGVNMGKMMRSEAITYRGKVFAFFSMKRRMVFRLGKELPPEIQKLELSTFNPFKKRGPLNGWYESPYEQNAYWQSLSIAALNRTKEEI